MRRSPKNPNTRVVSKRGHIWRPENLESLLDEIQSLEAEAEEADRFLLWRGQASKAWLLESKFFRNVKQGVLGFRPGHSATEHTLSSPWYSRALRSLLLWKFGTMSGPSEELHELESLHPGTDRWFELLRRVQQYPEDDTAPIESCLRGSNLLDFSRSFEVALWFALETNKADTEPALYVYDPAEAGPVLSTSKVETMLEQLGADIKPDSTPHQPMIFHPRKQPADPRVKAQQAVYIAQMAPEHSLDHVWAQQEDSVDGGGRIFIKFVLNKDLREEIRHWLPTQSITRTAIYPDLPDDIEREPTPRAEFVARIRTVVAADMRFQALLAGGSWAHGDMDRHSDLDLIIVVDEGCYAEVMAVREAIAQSIGGLMAAFTGEHVGEPRLLICLYGPPLLHVDLKFVTAEDLDDRVERPAIVFARDPAAIERRLDAANIAWPDRPPPWFEQRAWIWLHYAATKLGRGELLEAIAMLAFFRDQVLGPMLHRRAGRPQRGVRRLEQQAEGVDGRLLATVTGHDAQAVRDGIRAAAELYLDLRGDQPPDSPVANMPSLLFAFLDTDP